MTHVLDPDVGAQRHALSARSAIAPQTRHQAPIFRAALTDGLLLQCDICELYSQALMFGIETYKHIAFFDALSGDKCHFDNLASNRWMERRRLKGFSRANRTQQELVLCKLFTVSVKTSVGVDLRGDLPAVALPLSSSSHQPPAKSPARATTINICTPTASLRKPISAKVVDLSALKPEGASRLVRFTL